MTSSGRVTTGCLFSIGVARFGPDRVVGHSRVLGGPGARATEKISVGVCMGEGGVDKKCRRWWSFAVELK